MKPAIFRHLFTIYHDQIAKVVPQNDPLRVLTTLAIFQDGPLTEKEVIERTGFGQSAVSKLLRKFCAVEIVMPSGRQKRYAQALVLTEKGRRLWARFEDAIENVLSIELKESPVEMKDFSDRGDFSRAWATANPEGLKRLKERESWKVR